MSSEKKDNEKIVVVADPDLKELIPSFLQCRKNDVATIRALIEEKNFDKVRLLGHNMKGSGEGYGFPPVTEIGNRIEQAAAAQDEQAVLNAVSALEEYVRNVEVVYE